MHRHQEPECNGAISIEIYQLDPLNILRDFAFLIETILYYLKRIAINQLVQEYYLQRDMD